MTRAIASGPTQVEHHPDGRRGEVHAVGDELDDGLAARGGGEARRDRAGVAVVQRPHAVEQVRDGRAGRTGAPGAAERRAGLRDRGSVGDARRDGVGVPERRDGADLGERPRPPRPAPEDAGDLRGATVIDDQVPAGGPRDLADERRRRPSVM